MLKIKWHRDILQQASGDKSIQKTAIVLSLESISLPSKAQEFIFPHALSNGLKAVNAIGLDANSQPELFFAKADAAGNLIELIVLFSLCSI